MAALAAAVWLAGCGVDDAERSPAPAAATFVGSAACRDCHESEHAAWSGSHHDLALGRPEPGTVLGDFADAVVEIDGRVSRFFRRGDDYLVATEAADGAIREFRVVHTFGVEPLQQYLVEHERGRLQALTLAWDARPAETGGQRWFDLYAEPAAPGDPLHWTGPLQNWNSMCADCHSTAVAKRFALDSDSYATSFVEEDVGCESCHGPASLHAERPQAQQLRLSQEQGTWVFGEAGPIAARAGEAAGSEIAVCAQCHSRRAQLRDAEPLAGYLEAYRPEWLARGLYHDDGQVREEVYVYGSFLQSRMHAAGVTCSDCHEPHGLRLRASGDALCARCHAADTFAAESHHRHVDPPACVDCHMRAETFMQVDERRDHSFRVPRPDLSLELGSPNACNDCHSDRDAGWAAAVVEDWFPQGRSGTEHYGQAFAAARDWQIDALTALLPIATDVSAPAIVRATAIAGIGARINDAEPAALDALAGDASDLVKLALIDASRDMPPERRVALVQRFLSDAPRALRVAAAESLQPARAALGPGRQADLDAALEEAIEARRFGGDRPEGLIGLATIAAGEGRDGEARQWLGVAIERFPWFVPAYVNLADLERASGRNEAALDVVEAGLAEAPDADALHVARGLALVRLGLAAEAVEAFAEARALAPDSPYNAYLHGVALHSTGAADEGIAALETAATRWPAYADIWYALATMQRDAARLEQAVSSARRGRQAAPGDARFDVLLEAFGAR